MFSQPLSFFCEWGQLALVVLLDLLGKNLIEGF